MSRERTPAYRAVVNGETVNMELMGLREAGKSDIKWVHVRAAPFNEKGNRLVFLSFVDVTESVKVQEIEGGEAALQEKKIQFVQNTSHELRTPLTLILGYLEYMQSDPTLVLGEPHEHYFGIILERSRHLRRMLDQMLALYEAGSAGYYNVIRNKFTPVFIVDLVIGAVDDFKLFADESNVTVSVGRIDDALAIVVGHRTLIIQAIDNVLRNAIKFTASTSGEVAISVRLIADEIVVVVRDTGIGIPTNELKFIFDLFYQIDGVATRHYPGSGLGLAVVKEVMEFHCGCVTVESEVGKGSVFSLRFPVNECV